MIFFLKFDHNKNSFKSQNIQKVQSTSNQPLIMVGINEDHMDLSQIPIAVAENEVCTFWLKNLPHFSFDYYQFSKIFHFQVQKEPLHDFKYFYELHNKNRSKLN